MGGSQQFQTPEEAETTLKRAVELYHRDRTHQEAVEAARGALGELDIPADYYDAAQKEREQQQAVTEEQKRQRKIALQDYMTAIISGEPKTISEAVARLINEWGVLLLLGAACFLFSVWGALSGHDASTNGSSSVNETPVHEGGPQKWDFGLARNDFLLDTNPQTDAQMIKVKEGDSTFERIQIHSFGIDPKVSNDASANSYYAKAYLNDQTVYFNGVHTLTFKARSKGISTLYIGFTDANNSAARFSDDLDLTPNWNQYTVDLDKLRRLDDSGNWVDDGKPPAEGGLYFFTGDNINDLKESGNVDFKDVELSN